MAKRISWTGAYGSAEAKLLEAELKAQYRGAQPAPEKRMTVLDLYAENMGMKRSRVRVVWYEKIEGIMKNHVIPVIGGIKLDRLSTSTLQKWANGISERDLAISTKKHIYSELRALLNYAVKMEYIPKNPLLIVGNFRETIFE